MKHQIWKRVLSFVLAVLTVVGGLYIPDQSREVVALEQDTNDYILNMDFEDQVDLKQFGTNDTKLEVKDLDGDKVLAVTHAGTTTNGEDGVWHELEGITDSVTLSYNVMYTSSADDYLPSLSTAFSAKQSNYFVRLENRANDKNAPVRWYNNNSNKGYMTADGSQIAFANNVWHSVKMICTKDDSGWSASVYIDGRLTNAGVNLTTGAVSCFSMRWQSDKSAGRTIYLDNIRVSKGDHDAVPASFTALQFEQATYRMEPGDEIPVVAKGTPAAAKVNTVSYVSSQETVATVDE